MSIIVHKNPRKTKVFAFGEMSLAFERNMVYIAKGKKHAYKLEKVEGSQTSIGDDGSFGFDILPGKDKKIA